MTNCWVSFSEQILVVFARPELEDVSNVQVRVSGLVLVAVTGFDSLPRSKTKPVKTGLNTDFVINLL